MSKSTSSPALTPKYTHQHPASQSKQGTLWTEEEDKLLLGRLSHKVPISEISQEISRTPKAITRRMDRLRSQRSINFDLYMSYYNNDPAFASHRRFK